MTFLDALTGAADLTRSQLASVVRQGLSEGLSGNAMLQGLQEAGSGIRRGDFQALVREVRASTAMAGAWAGLPLESPVEAGMAVEWQGGAIDTYLHRIYTYYREFESPGVATVYRSAIDVLSANPLSPADAIANAHDAWSGSSDRYTNRELLGMEFGGLYHQLGRAS